jgi:hypothetical protein
MLQRQVGAGQPKPTAPRYSSAVQTLTYPRAKLPREPLFKFAFFIRPSY